MRPRRVSLPRLSDRLSLGPSGLKVSPACLGISRPEAVVEAFDAGINFFFLTADMHWPLYEGLRKGLEMLFERRGGVRDDTVVGVVSYLSRPDQLSKPFSEVIDAVSGLDRIDVCVAGWVVTEDDPGRSARIRSHREAGKFGCRAVGASYHHRSLVAPAVERGDVDVAFIRYNAEHPGARDDIFPHLGERTALVYGFKSMQSWVSPAELQTLSGLPEGTWIPDMSDAYRFALSAPEMDGVLCALHTGGHVRDLAEALGKGPLEPEEEEHMIDLVALVTGKARLADADDASRSAP